jgi:hypothetical protein
MFVRFGLCWWLTIVFVSFLAGGFGAAKDEKDTKDKKERDIFDYAAQKAATGVKKIVFVADTAPHGGRGNHEFLAGAIYLAVPSTPITPMPTPSSTPRRNGPKT